MVINQYDVFPTTIYPHPYHTTDNQRWHQFQPGTFISIWNGAEDDDDGDSVQWEQREKQQFLTNKL